MPYQSVLEDLVRAVSGSGALLLDAEGEVIAEGGARDERHRLIGAYQGLGLAAARRAVEGCGQGPIQYMLSRYAAAVVILRPLKDGYYLVLSLPDGGRLGESLHESGRAQERLNQVL